MSSMFLLFQGYLDLSKLTQFSWDMGLCTQEYNVHACYLVCLGNFMYRSGMFLSFQGYLGLSNMTQFGWDMGLCMQEHNMQIGCIWILTPLKGPVTPEVGKGGWGGVDWVNEGLPQIRELRECYVIFQMIGTLFQWCKWSIIIRTS